MLIYTLWETLSTNDEKEVYFYVIQKTCLDVDSNTICNSQELEMIQMPISSRMVKEAVI